VALAGATKRAGAASSGQTSPDERAPWKDHDLCNPPTADRSCAEAGTAGAAKDRRRTSYILRDALRPISVKRVEGCGRRRIAFQVEVVRRPFNDASGGKRYHAHFHGILRCGSAWECPVCAFQIRAERSRQVEEAAARWGIDRMVMLSLTVRHGLGHNLKTVRQGLTRAYSRLVRGEPWKRIKRRYGLRHSIRALEVTHGPNGWHPHLHVQWFLDAALSAEMLAEVEAWLRDKWQTCVIRELGAEHAPNGAHGVDLRPTRRGDYAFKMALELVDPGTKYARRGHRTPWQIAADYAEYGRESDAALWRNYCEGMRGAQMHHWSDGLRKAVRLDEEKTEQQIVDGEQMPEDEIVAVLDPSAWAAVAQRGPEAVLLILYAAENTATATDCDAAIRDLVHGLSRGS
jgi:hypothetical protein